ncbi:MAG: hypothetical protein JWO95_128 [Verrucomicrobiales bacterium]|nr:hypothetical protein [Verrucomicrobiales bacterium]
MRTAASFALLLSICLLVASTNSSRAQTNNVEQTTTAELVAPAGLSKGASDVVKLLRAGKPDNVLLFYVKYSELDYRLSAADVIYLTKVGISTNLITAMMETDAERQKALTVKFDEDRLTTAVAAAPDANQVAPMPVVSTRAVVQQNAPAVEQPEFTPSIVYPDYSAFPNYYETFDNSDHHHGRVSVAIGIGVGVGFGDGGYGRGYGGYGYGRGGHFGGRR